MEEEDFKLSFGVRRNFVDRWVKGYREVKFGVFGF